MKSLLDRLADKVLIGDGCWEWTGTKPNGYGQLHVGGRARRPAHCVMYELLVGPIPEGLELDHLCRNPGCVRPDHLEPVTPRENTHRSTAPTAVNAAKTHCVHGDEFTPENTYVRPASGRQGRECRACTRRRDRAKRAKRANP